jgi:hypothetical protein
MLVIRMQYFETYRFETGLFTPVPQVCGIISKDIPVVASIEALSYPCSTSQSDLKLLFMGILYKGTSCCWKYQSWEG